jgi:hypothetical protein
MPCILIGHRQLAHRVTCIQTTRCAHKCKLLMQRTSNVKMPAQHPNRSAKHSTAQTLRHAVPAITHISCSKEAHSSSVLPLQVPCCEGLYSAPQKHCSSGMTILNIAEA